MKLLAYGVLILALVSGAARARAAERLVGVQSARVISQSMPWIAEETGIFRKYNGQEPGEGDSSRLELYVRR